MLISQSWKETGNRKQETGFPTLMSLLMPVAIRPMQYVPFLSLSPCLLVTLSPLLPASCLLSVITATPKGNKSASHDQKSYLHCDLIDEGESDVEG